MVHKKNSSLRVEQAKQNLRVAAAAEPPFLHTVRAAVRCYPKTGLMAGFVAGLILGSSAEARQTVKFILTTLLNETFLPEPEQTPPGGTPVHPPK
ncbi:MAG: hypothetical protein R2940_02290 [Syntrophotaleaceae bacterium]